jgi:hypothetical protein
MSLRSEKEKADQLAILLKAGLRESMYETLSVCIFHANMVCNYLTNEDDAGTIYQARQMMECIKAFLTTHNELVAMSERGHE